MAKMLFALLLMFIAFVCAATAFARRIVRAVRHIHNRIVFIQVQLKKILALLTPGEGAVVEFYEMIDGKEIKVDHMFKKVDAAFRLKVAFKDAKGNDAKVDGAPVWAVSDEALAEVVADESGLAATVTPKGPVGSFKVQCSADADLGEGLKSILGEAQVDLLPGDAEVVEISEE